MIVLRHLMLVCALLTSLAAVGGCGEQSNPEAMGSWKSDDGRVITIKADGRLMDWNLNKTGAMRGDYEWQNSDTVKFYPKIDNMGDGKIYVLDGPTYKIISLAEQVIVLEEHHANGKLNSRFTGKQVDSTGSPAIGSLVGRWRSAKGLPIDKRILQELFQSASDSKTGGLTGEKSNVDEPEAEVFVFNADGTMTLLAITSNAAYADDSGVIRGLEGHYWMADETSVTVYSGWPPESMIYEKRIDDEGQLFMNDNGPYIHEDAGSN